ncbi:MAG: hypothetical protein ACREM3_13000 [Candidatus Rokuibacteriota bacterium]
MLTILLLVGCSAPLMFMPLPELRSLPPNRTLTARGADYRDVAECIVDEMNAARPVGSGWDEPLLLDWTMFTRRARQLATVTGTWSLEMMSLPVVDLTLTQQGDDVRIEERIGRWRDDAEGESPRGLRKAGEYARPIIERCAGARVVVEPPLRD